MLKWFFDAEYKTVRNIKNFSIAIQYYNIIYAYLHTYRYLINSIVSFTSYPQRPKLHSFLKFSRVQLLHWLSYIFPQSSVDIRSLIYCNWHQRRLEDGSSYTVAHGPAYSKASQAQPIPKLKFWTFLIRWKLIKNWWVLITIR